MASIEIITNYCPEIPLAFANADFENAFRNGMPDGDPNIPPEVLRLGFAQPGGRWKIPEHRPTDLDFLFRWEFRDDSDEAVVTPLIRVNESPSYIPLTSRAKLTEEDITWAKSNPLIVDLVAAALAVYKDADGHDEIPAASFDKDANARVMQNLTSGGVTHASNLDLKGFGGLKELVAIAAFMDTACRTPDKMSPKLVKVIFDWLGEFKSETLWIGAGTEHVPFDKRIDEALLKGELTQREYIDFRTIQLDMIRAIGKRAILFPDQMQNGLPEHVNVEILRALFSKYEGEIVEHKLGSPFNPKTDWHTRPIVAQTADLAFAVKTSTPRFPDQVEDRNAVMEAASRTHRKPIVYTGDDRGFAFGFEYGAREQLGKHLTGAPDHTYSRNGFQFIKDVNVSGLLGYIGLNPFQTIAAVIKLSRWYHEKSKGAACNEAVAREHLSNYWALMKHAQELSTDSFFGPTDPTPAYTQRVYWANRFTGVLNESDGKVLKHRQTSWQDPEDQAILARRLLVQMVIAGAITPQELRQVVQTNKQLLMM